MGDDVIDRPSPWVPETTRRLPPVAIAPHRAPPATDLPPELVALQDLLPHAVFSADGRVLRSNAAYATLLGRPPAALVGRHRRQLVAPAPEDEGQPALWAALRSGLAHDAQYRVERPDGAERWISSTFRPVLDADGALREVVELAADVTAELHRRADENGQVRAIHASHAVLHLGVDGTILDANERFAAMLGYGRAELVGRHHRSLVDPDHAAGAGYVAFWAALARGEHQSAEFKRLGRDRREVWLQASYNPIVDPSGRITKIIAYATDVTEAKLRQADYQWQVAAIHKSHAVITFTMDGLILDANETFLEAVGYALHEVVGRHHRMFVEPSHAHGAEYAAFWRELAAGRHQSGQYRRLGRGEREIWLQASYNPVFDLNGRPVKVIKYATVVTEEKLRQADHQGQIAAINLAQCVIAFDLEGRILDANDNFLDAVGYRLAEVRGRHHSMFVEPGYAAGAEYAAFWTALAAGRHQAGEFKRIAKDGSELWLQANYNPIFDLNGRPFRVVKYATDITADKRRAVDVQGQLEAISKSQSMASFALDGTLLDANPRFLSTMGYPLDELRGRHHRMLVDATQAASAEYAAFWSTLRSGEFVSGLYRRRSRDGGEVWIQASYNPILDLNGFPFKVVEFATDVTANVAMSEAYEDAKRRAQHDSATALPNRARLSSFMEQALATPGSRLAVFYLDLDGFRTLNDAHGHQCGDRVLGEVADRLRRALSFEQMAARIGGDEFVVAAPDLADDEIERFAQHLVDVVGAPIRHEGAELPLGVSIGVATAPADSDAPDELLRCADVALERSRQDGGGRFSFFAQTRNQKLQSYRNLVEDMRRGLAENEFLLEYQPRYETGSQHIRAAEALLRWNHPERGRVAPADFIPAAERSGLIIELGEWVLRTACRAAASWPGTDTGISVNVSPRQFQAIDLVELTRDVLAETGLPPSRLELEITEGVLLEDAQHARTTLDGLKALGVRLAMDDFGTGYSSLSSLRSFPFDVIKVDRQFIADIGVRDGGRDVVQAILGLGRALNLSVTAEGVETDDQLAMLAADRCDEVQGFLLARPMPENRMLDLLRSAMPLPIGSTPGSATA